MLSENAHRMVKRLHEEIVKAQMSLGELSRRSGIPKTTIRAWFQSAYTINLQSLDACLGVLGMMSIATMTLEGRKKKCKDEKPAVSAVKPKTSLSTTPTPPSPMESVQPAKPAPALLPEKPKKKSVVKPVSFLDDLPEPQPIVLPKKKIKALF